MITHFKRYIFQYHSIQSIFNCHCYLLFDPWAISKHWGFFSYDFIIDFKLNCKVTIAKKKKKRVVKNNPKTGYERIAYGQQVLLMRMARKAG